MSLAEPHDVLGVDLDASPDEIRAAFRVLARIYHPDRHADAPPAVQAEAGRKMAELNTAYQALMDVAAMDVVYGTAGWTNRDRAQLTESLLNSGVPHEWDGTDLTVARSYEQVVDQTISRRR